MPKRPADQKRAVWEGKIPKTASGLTRKDLAVSKSTGKIVSKKKQQQGKKLMAAMMRDPVNKRKIKAQQARLKKTAKKKTAKKRTAKKK